MLSKTNPHNINNLFIRRVYLVTLYPPLAFIVVIVLWILSYILYPILSALVRFWRVLLMELKYNKYTVKDVVKKLRKYWCECWNDECNNEQEDDL